MFGEMFGGEAPSVYKSNQEGSGSMSACLDHIWCICYSDGKAYTVKLLFHPCLKS